MTRRLFNQRCLAAAVMVSIGTSAAALLPAQSTHHRHHHASTPVFGGTTIFQSFSGQGFGGLWGPAAGGYIVPGLVGGPAPIVSPPVINQPAVPAEALFAPAVARRFGTAAPAPEELAQPGADARNMIDPRVRVSNADFRARARQFLQYGDEHFRKQKFHDAYQRYKDASTAAPDLAEPYLREGLALSAIGQYASAARALKRGLMLDPAWPRSGFQLGALYGGNKLAETAHREAIAKRAIDEPNDPGLLFLLAVELYFDGEVDRSRAFFWRARDLDPEDSPHVRLFLDAIATRDQKSL